MTHSTEKRRNGQPMNFSASAAVIELINIMGRTEDLIFSPDCRRLAVAGFKNNSIYLFSVDFTNRIGQKTIHLENYAVIRSNSLRQPHGIAFIDHGFIVVANRAGVAEILPIPENLESNADIQVSPVASIRTNYKCRVKSPGSIISLGLDDGNHRILVCNNYIHTVTSHNVDFRRKKIVRNEGVLIRKGLKIPDGICVSSDRRWVAVSNHSTGTVLIYELGPMLNRKSEPCGELQGIVCPHGLRFSEDGEMLFVADSASPYIHIYTATEGGWHSKQKAYKSIRILDEEVFERGRYNAEEGGLKGMDVNFKDRVIAVSCEHLGLAFYDLDDLINMPALQVDDEINAKSLLRDHQIMGA